MAHILPLRPHHGMCLAFFQGKGYSEGFVAHMAKTRQNLLEQNPLIRLVCQADEICSACPNRQGSACMTEENVQHYDRAVLALTGLEEGSILPFASFSEKVSSQILQAGHRHEICPNCQWTEFCSPFKFV